MNGVWRGVVHIAVSGGGAWLVYMCEDGSITASQSSIYDDASQCFGATQATAVLSSYVLLLSRLALTMALSG